MATASNDTRDSHAMEAEEEGVPSSGNSKDTLCESEPRLGKGRTLTKEDSGIHEDHNISDGGKSPNVSAQDTGSDADMNDPDWIGDSAMPSSCVSASAVDSKSDSSGIQKSPASGVTNGEDDSSKSDKEDVMSVDRDEVLHLDSEIEMDCPTTSTAPDILKCHFPHSSTDSDNSPGSKRTTASDDGDGSPVAKRITPDKWDEDEDGLVERQSESDRAVPDDSEDRPSEDLPDLTSDSSDDDDGDEEQRARSLSAFSQRVARRRAMKRRLLRRLVDSSEEDSDSSDNENADNDNNDSRESGRGGKASEDDLSDTNLEMDTEAILNKPQPKPNWFPIPELRRREYGCLRRESTEGFRERVQGSLQMVKRLVLEKTMKGHEGCVNALSFNRIGTLLASGSDDLNIILWNWQRARASLLYDSGHRSNVFQAKFLPFSGDCHVISCARDGQVRLAELSLTGVCKATRKLAQHRGAAHKLALEMDSPNVFLSCGEDALTYLFDLRQEKPHKLVTTKDGEKKVPLYSIHSNPRDSQQFCVGGRDHYIRVYDKRKISEDVDGGILKKYCPDHLINSVVKANVTCACYNYNGSEILGTYNDEDIYLFDNTQSDGANFIHRYSGHRNNATVKGVNFYGPKSEFIVSGSDCGNVYFWDKETEAIINFQQGDEAGVINVLEPHPTLPLLATSGLDHEVKLWSPAHQEPRLDQSKLKKTIKKNLSERKEERASEPEMIGGQMLWFLMHHFRNTARRRMREEGHELSTSDSDDNSDDDDDGAASEMQCTQS